MMYATLVSWDRQSRSIARRTRLIAGLVAASVLACTDLRSAEPWHDAPEYLALFGEIREIYKANVKAM